jgi:hypothetical protein
MGATGDGAAKDFNSKRCCNPQSPATNARRRKRRESNHLIRPTTVPASNRTESHIVVAFATSGFLVTRKQSSLATDKKASHDSERLDVSINWNNNAMKPAVLIYLPLIWPGVAKRRGGALTC